MKKKIITGLITLFVWLIVVITGFGQQSGLSDEVIKTIKSRIEGGNNVGVVVGIIDKNGPRYYAYGKVSLDDDLVPNEHTVFEIGSISKVFTSILLADMAKNNELKIDDSAQKYLPDNVKVPKRNDKQIRLSHLATHTSGLPRLPDNMNPANPNNPYADYSVKQMYDFLSNHTLRRDIGAKYEYSNLAVGLLGHILALKNGTSYEKLMKTRIADVIGLDETRITLTSDMQQHLAKGYSNEMEAENWDLPTLAGAGAIRSTAYDMLRFLEANIGLEKTPLYSAMKLTHKPRENTGPGGVKIGLGWHIKNSNGKEVVWHNGGTGGYRSFAGFVRKDNTGVVVLTNSIEKVDDIGFHLLDSSNPMRKLKPSATAMLRRTVDKNIKVETETLKTYLGEYQLAPAFSITITIDGDRLFAQATGQGRHQIFPISKTKFFYKVVDAQITFNSNASGKVESLTLHQNGLDMPGMKK